MRSKFVNEKESNLPVLQLRNSAATSWLVSVGPRALVEVSDPLGCKCKPKSKTGTLSEKAVKRLRRKEAQKHFDHVCMEGTELENVLCFTYLGSNFEADGDCEQDVKIRMAIAKSTFGKLMEIWKAEEISLKQKLRLYSAAVISIVSFGFETWEMPQKLEDSLRGWNARCLAAITGREIPQDTLVLGVEKSEF